MELMMGIFLIVIGGIMLIRPKIIWRVGESWKINAYVEPNESYIIFIRIGGCILVISGIYAILQM